MLAFIIYAFKTESNINNFVQLTRLSSKAILVDIHGCLHMLIMFTSRNHFLFSGDFKANGCEPKSIKLPTFAYSCYFNRPTLNCNLIGYITIL